MSLPVRFAAGPGLTLLLTDGEQRSAAETLSAYTARGGYAGLSRVLAEGPAWALETLGRAGVRGRGAFGELAAHRWRRVARAPSPVRYVIGNGAEGSPVSWKDRHLLAFYPHRVLEGLLIATIVLDAQESYLYVRGDSPEALHGASLALAEAHEAGILGEGGWTGVQVLLQPSAPGPISGEQTAVIDALEGLEGRPQLCPPDPEECGLRGRPTLVQNVETLAAVAALFRVGLERYALAGAQEDPGTALFTVSGAVGFPGVYELRLGTPLAELLRLAGADPAGVQAVLPGGLWSPPLWPEEFDVPLSWGSLARAGSALGNRAVVVLGRDAPVREQIGRLVQVLAEGSCGQCQGCANGTAALAEAMKSGALDVAYHQALLLTRKAGNCAYPEAVGRVALRALAALARTRGT